MSEQKVCAICEMAIEQPPDRAVPFKDGWAHSYCADAEREYDDWQQSREGTEQP